MKIGITCYPSIGGSGILASSLGEELARRGHEVHFISYDRPVRLPPSAPRIHFHPVGVSSYGLFRYPDYTLPLSVKMAEVSRAEGLDILHVHYAVPHATAALLARSMLEEDRAPRIVTTLHGTDTTLLGQDPGYGPAIRHALTHSDGITTVSRFMEAETRRVLGLDRAIRVIPNFFEPKVPGRSREHVRAELGLAGGELLIFHASNLRPLKRIDLLLEAAARLRAGPGRVEFKLLILAGGSFAPFESEVRRLGLEGRLVVREEVSEIEDYLQAADLGLFASDSESFCLSILEAMAFGCPSVSTAVGGVPEVVEAGKSGVLVPPGDAEALACAVRELAGDAPRRQALGRAARERARSVFSADRVVRQYEDFYEDVVTGRTAGKTGS